MSYTLGEAAKTAGFSKPTLSRAIKNGKLSAKRLDDGSYSIDPAELERWKDANGHRNASVKRSKTQGETPSQNSALQAEVEALREKIKSSDIEKGYLEQRIEDLKERAERAERKEDQLHALLADLRPKAAEAPEPAKKGWLARLVG